jgi:LEA14-like dessication related protein
MIQHLRISLIMGFIAIGIFGCRKPKDLQYIDFENFQVQELGLGESVISADLKYYNPNNFKLNLKDGDLNVSLNNTFLGNSKLDTLLQIPKKDTFLIPLKMKVDMKTFLSKALNVLLTNEVDVKLDGNAKLGKAGIYFNVPIHYQGKQKFNLNFFK